MEQKAELKIERASDAGILNSVWKNMEMRTDWAGPICDNDCVIQK